MNGCVYENDKRSCPILDHVHTAETTYCNMDFSLLKARYVHRQEGIQRIICGIWSQLSLRNLALRPRRAGLPDPGSACLT